MRTGIGIGIGDGYVDDELGEGRSPDHSPES